jgi:hypothetical protein
VASLIEIAGIEVSLEDDSLPVVRAIAADLIVCLHEAEFTDLTRRTHGVACVRSADTPQAVTARIADGRVALAHGSDAEPDVTATAELGNPAAELAINGAKRHPDLAQWTSRLLRPPMPPLEVAAERFWSELSSLQRSPRALVLVDLRSGERRRYGPDYAPGCELHGTPAALLSVLTGRSSAIEAAFDGTVLIHGSFPDLSVLSGAGFRVRYGGIPNGA